MLQEDPALEGVAAILFDEFHERSLQADLGLALALDAQAVLRPDLRIVIMSATLDATGIGKWLQALLFGVTAASTLSKRTTSHLSKWLLPEPVLRSACNSWFPGRS
ncbi:hypothetical protein [Pontibacter sp. BAB1700]|uniref:hypothetical protein n=1 Tax=Pontibacter sp. BAB1700 TaxID=1144253 RepID=UPI0002E81089|nr:hypothetical protein [Pontibacter sp. BAB1700]